MISAKYKKQYDLYMKSEKWAIKRKQKAIQASFRCEVCDKVILKGFHIHHKTYKNFGNEPLNDLQFLCEECHINAHCRIKAEALNKTKKLSERKDCNNCYYSQLETHYRKNGNRKFVLYCNKNMDICDGICRYYRKGAYKQMPKREKKNKPSKIKRNKRQ